MAKRAKVILTVQPGSDGKPLSGVGPGVGLAFIKVYFPEAQHKIRIATAYFRLRGYKAGRKYIAPHVQFHILVGREEGYNVHATVIDDIVAELGQCETDLWETVFELVERMK